jgi:signal transduction histidine kinase
VQEHLPGSPHFERELFDRFNRQGAGALSLIAQHRSLEETLHAVCKLIEVGHPDKKCIVVERLDDDRLDFYGSVASVAALGSVVSALLIAEFGRLDAVDDQATALRVHHSARSSSHRVWCLPFVGLGTRPLGALCVSYDTERVNDYRDGELRHSADLAQLAIEQATAARNFAGTIAAERERIANQIHDDPIQAITMLSLTLQRIGLDLPPETRPLLDDVQVRVGDTIERLRHLLFELHPSTLEDEGLAVAIEVYLEETFSPHGTLWSIENHIDVTLDDAVSTLAFRLVHEALVNVAKHADAKTVSVTLTNTENQLRIRIDDDGQGFDLDTVPRFRPGHLGLPNVRYLARRAAGVFEVTTAPGQGCIVEIELPFRKRVLSAPIEGAVVVGEPAPRPGE